MKLTKKLEAEILKVYNTYWDYYLNGDMKGFASMLDENCQIIGSAKSEVFNNKRSAIKHYKATAGQVTGKAQFRNREISMMPVENSILVTEQSDFYVLIDNIWTFYGHGRLSTLLHKKRNKWKVIQQHGSLPDSRTGEGEQLNTDPIKAENLQLRDAIKRRTLELEEKNHELEIEAALEKIRSRSLAMHKSDELWEVVAVVFEKLQELKFSIDGAAFIMTFIEGTKDLNLWIGDDKGQSYPTSLRLSFNEAAPVKDVWLAGESGIDFLSKTYPFEEKNRWFRYAFEHTDIKKLSDELKNWILEQPCLTQAFALGKNSVIGIHFHHQKTLSETEVDILKRFSKVFDQAYIRFLDLQKAEAQARESQIQLAMERVRARTMAMQKSEELPEAANLLFQQVQSLGMPAWSAGYCIWDEDKKAITLWMSSEGVLQPPFRAPLTQDPSFIHLLEAHQRGETFAVEEIGGEDLVTHYKYMRTLPVVGEILDKIIEAGFPLPTFQIFHSAYFSKGFLLFITYESVPEAHDIFRRFAKVFEQTYTRFLDLQKAEAQARESQIQLALERVRARTMAMQKSEELEEAANLLFKQVQSLNIPVWSCGYNIWEKGEKYCTGWMSSDGMIQPSFKIPLTESPTFIRFYESKEKGEIFYAEEVGGEALADHYRYMLSLPDFAPIAKKHIKAGYPLPTFQINHVANFNFGNLIFITSVPVPESHEIFKRFAKVFEQTYTRFLDLQKAEAQAREAKVEAALERVRSRTMAMHKSDELAETAAVLFKQLINLGIEPNRLYIAIINDDSGNLEFWITDEDGNKVSSRYIVNIHKNISIRKMYEGWKENRKTLLIDMQGEELVQWLTYWNKEFGVPFKEGAGKQRRVQNISYFSHGFVAIASWGDQPQETILLLDRFATVFNLTYTRFLDLQRAEAQSRESQIELGLERVRARAMAMQKSGELSELVDTVFKELTNLDFALTWCIINIIDESSMSNTVWAANPDIDKSPESYHMLFEDYPFHHAMMKGWKERKTKYVYTLEGLEKKVYDEYLFNETEFRKVPEAAQAASRAIEKYVVSFSFSNFGGLQTVGDAPLSDANLDILSRFGKVFDLTYTRFNDLKQAEVQALGAIKRASVDRVRAEIASMRTTNDLQRITPLIWNELTSLDIPFTRCGVFIMDETRQEVQTMLSTPDGKAIATLHVPFEFDLSITTNGVHYWRRKEIYKEHWDRAAFTKSWGKLTSLSGTSIEASHAADSPESLHLHLLPFLQGMLYVGNDAPLNEDALNLVQNLADAFATAYARYEDFNKLEAAKKQVDSTLNELQTTQKQLIQSEKMASLGELTAGIAHEIQNPLNFVNNFSEVNRELISELVDEVDKGNMEEVKAIVKDIKNNEEKINHHGRRADAIVKGMLQHSRSTSTTKELTDINALADEYLRLSYHGLRAKDKSVNATMKTDFDETIGRINVVPQDIGRVLLNLYNNAFYAAPLPPKAGLPDSHSKHIPTVWVKTLKTPPSGGRGAFIEIRVADNGPGIPANILDKIFQPFFTTKPTGQGTGLGLSLAYDIVKAHDGELKVETKEGKGSEFIIQLPIV